ncbi:flagellar biosynthetic protein FliO [Oceanobacillus chungangensis]|uniref:Flagellar protein n=1 Tax=Oceanobacillus chungangensis TaxID=1229152 RepID=A0A3D8PPG4_9BACI|nr:flagellar biosynthetic protein FliO [Oceanobacillus chungangensis]RDW17824.1 flagellar protein [Oceanobacillus chungangensis]
MKFKIIVYLCVAVVLSLYVFPSITVVAATSNAKDCIEKDIDCDEMNDNLHSDSKEENEELLTGGDNTEALALSIVRMFFALVLVLALIYFLLRFLNKRNKLLNNQVKALEKLGGISLGQNKTIQLVRVGNQVFLLGVGDNIELLMEITEEEVKEGLLHKDENLTNDFISSSLFSSIFQLKTDDNKATDGKKFKKLFSNELDELKKNREKLIKTQEQKEDNNE